MSTLTQKEPLCVSFKLRGMTAFFEVATEEDEMNVPITLSVFRDKEVASTSSVHLENL